MVKRSKSVPLNVCADVHSGGSLLDLLQCIGRVRTLFLTNKTNNRPALLAPLESIKVPTLKILSIVLNRPDFRYNPVNFFSEGSPNLTYMRLVNCLFIPTSPVYKNLLYLNLELLSFGTEGKGFLVGHLLDVLRETPMLQRLRVRCSYQKGDSLTSPQAGLIPLKSLSFFEGSGSFSQIAWLLEHIDFLPNTALQVSNGSGERAGELEELFSLLPYVENALQTALDEDYADGLVCGIFCESQHVNFRTWTSANSRKIVHPKFYRLNISFSFSGIGTDSLTTIFDTFCEFLPTSLLRIRRLSIQCYSARAAGRLAWLKFFDSVPALTSIRVQGEEAEPEFVHGLGMLASRISGDGNIPLANLRRIVISTTHPWNDKLLKPLTSFLEKRQQQRLGIRELRLCYDEASSTNFALPDSASARLGPFVESMSVDETLSRFASALADYDGFLEHPIKFPWPISLSPVKHTISSVYDDDDDSDDDDSW